MGKTSCIENLDLDIVVGIFLCRFTDSVCVTNLKFHRVTSEISFRFVRKTLATAGKRRSFFFCKLDKSYCILN